MHVALFLQNSGCDDKALAVALDEFIDALAERAKDAAHSAVVRIEERDEGKRTVKIMANYRGEE